MNQAGASSSVLRVAEIGGRGRGLVAAAPLTTGQVVLRDSPILLYSAIPFHSSSAAAYCHHCFRVLTSSSQKCPSCSTHLFCSPDCLASAISSSHTPLVCESLRRLHDCCSSAFADQPLERQVQARFLVAAYNLASVSPSNFQILLSLEGGGGGIGDSASPADVSAANFLHSLLISVCPPLPPSISPELTAALLAKDKLNAFGLMEPFSSSQEKRAVRAYGIYPTASFFNHDCLPNACRFDYVDSAISDRNTDIIVRIIHDVPEGREICLSYFPVNLNYASRQSRLLEDYGFTCDCDRCKVEANWSDNEDDSEDGEGELMDADDGDDQQMVGSDGDHEAMEGGDDSDFPHAYFFMRYMCNQENCWGTLAPLPPSDKSSAPSTVLECNVCGNLKEDEGVDANK